MCIYIRHNLYKWGHNSDTQGGGGGGGGLQHIKYKGGGNYKLEIFQDKIYHNTCKDIFQDSYIKTLTTFWDMVISNSADFTSASAMRILQ